MIEGCNRIEVGPHVAAYVSGEQHYSDTSNTDPFLYAMPKFSSLGTCIFTNKMPITPARNHTNLKAPHQPVLGKQGSPHNRMTEWSRSCRRVTKADTAEAASTAVGADVLAHYTGTVFPARSYVRSPPRLLLLFTQVQRYTVRRPSPNPSPK